MLRLNTIGQKRKDTDMDKFAGHKKKHDTAKKARAEKESGYRINDGASTSKTKTEAEKALERNKSYQRSRRSITCLII